MKASCDPVGFDNDAWLLKLSKESGIVIAAWGNDGCYLNRSHAVRKILSKLHYIKMNKSGEPAHPLYLKGDLQPLPMVL